MWTCYKRLFNEINVHSIICVAYKSHYEALNISKTATHKEIKDAYYRLSMIYHPDKNKGSEEAAKNFRDITKAYEVLGNVRQRRLYDSGADPNQNTSQYNPKRPFETMNEQSGVYRTNVRSRDHIFDDWSKAQYTNILREHNVNREKVVRQRINIQYAERQHSYNLLALMVFTSVSILFFILDYLKKLVNEHDKIEKNLGEKITK